MVLATLMGSCKGSHRGPTGIVSTIWFGGAKLSLSLNKEGPSLVKITKGLQTAAESTRGNHDWIRQCGATRSTEHLTLTFLMTRGSRAIGKNHIGAHWAICGPVCLAPSRKILANESCLLSRSGLPLPSRRHPKSSESFGGGVSIPLEAYCPGTTCPLNLPGTCTALRECRLHCTHRRRRLTILYMSMTWDLWRPPLSCCPTRRGCGVPSGLVERFLGSEKTLSFPGSW